MAKLAKKGRLRSGACPDGYAVGRVNGGAATPLSRKSKKKEKALSLAPFVSHEPHLEAGDPRILKALGSL